MPKLPPDVFTNFSPYPPPPAVNVLLLDSLNTRMESQSYVHTQAMKFLKGAKPGTRTAIFTMGLALHFIQGFNDDPAVLAAALNNKKNIEVEPAVMLKSQAEKNARPSSPSIRRGKRWGEYSRSRASHPCQPAAPGGFSPEVSGAEEHHLVRREGARRFCGREWPS